MSFPLKNLVGNHKSARPIVYKGVRYPSRRALAAALGISVVTLRRRLRERTPLESPTKVPLELLSERPKEPELTIRKHRGVVYKGVAYDTIYDCAAEFDLTPFTVRYRLKRNIPLEAPRNFRKVTVIDGKEWYSQKEIAEACGVSTGAIKYRLKEGKDISPDLCGRLGKACKYQGKRYPSIAALADAYGLTPPTCRKRLKAGTPLDAPVTHGFARPCEYKGVRYDSIEALAWAVKLTHDHARELVDREGKWL